MTQPFDDALKEFFPSFPLAVALSGGADSTALLVACARLWPGRVRAIHVNHGLQAAADAFERHCLTLCQTLDVPLDIETVDARPARGDSPEDAARRARYAALGRAATRAGVTDIALAQHADDQVETLLLAMSRGGGVAGLAAMPRKRNRDGIIYHRPLLRVAGGEVRAWARTQQVAWIDDPSNADQNFTRNRIRAVLVPALAQAMPQFRDTFSRSAEHCAYAAEILRDMAAIDLATVGTPPAIAKLQQLRRSRQANVLRHWMKLSHGTTPTSAQLSELLRQIGCCTTRAHRIELNIGRGILRREGSSLGWYKL